MNIRIYKYNNYYNRMVKILKTNDSIFSRYVHELRNANFNPNDNITTTHTFGSKTSSYDGTGDYLVCIDNNTIVSRWFILEAVRTLNGQWNLELRRDLVADYYDEIINDADIFIEKATLENNDDLIYNDEAITTNLIKQKEILLKDETKSQWLVAYVARQSSNPEDETQGGTAFPLDVNINYNLDYVPDYTVTSESQLEFYKYLNVETKYSGTPIIDIFFQVNSLFVSFNSFNIYGEAPVPLKLPAITVENGFGYFSKAISQSDYSNPENYNYVSDFFNKTPATTEYDSTYIYGNRFFANYIKNEISNTSWKTIQSQIDAASGNVESSKIGQYVNKVVKIGNELYKTELEIVSSNSNSVALTGSYPVIEEIVRAAYNSAIVKYKKDYPNLKITSTVPLTSSSSSKLVGIRAESSGVVKLKLRKLENTKTSAYLKTDSLALRCADAPYDLITMPYSDSIRIKVSNSEIYTSDKELALATMTSLLAQAGGVGPVKDVQLLPYCPIRQFIDYNGNIDLTTSTIDSATEQRVYFVKYKDTDVKIMPVIYCQTSSDSFDIPYSITINNKKMENQCDMYRLNSPNFASTFEFNAAKNNGVDKFNVDFNYKPFNPYIHVNPNFKKLYGKDFDDARGLICAGDFSITAVTDAWEQFELQNKNYEKTFQRQIENMEIQQKYARQGDIAKGITGVGTGIAAGAMAGGSIGGPIGAAAGAVIGLGASLYGGIKDYSINQKLRAEALDYTKDMFGYTLQNIAALPNTISRVSAINKNNKGFPVLEFYSCTEREKEAVARKIAYNGMTVMAIGRISDYLGNNWSYNNITSKGYIKGRLIRLDSINEDFHVINEISNELYKGVYI